MPSKGTPKRAIRIPDPLWEAARKKAEQRGETVAEVIRVALERYISQPDVDPR